MENEQLKNNTSEKEKECEIQSFDSTLLFQNIENKSDANINELITHNQNNINLTKAIKIEEEGKEFSKHKKKHLIRKYIIMKWIMKIKRVFLELEQFISKEKIFDYFDSMESPNENDENEENELNKIFYKTKEYINLQTPKTL